MVAQVTKQEEQAETLISVAQVAERLPRNSRGKKISVRTIIRWITHGHYGVFLEGERFGDTFCTTEQALKRFSNALIEQARSAAKAPVAKPQSAGGKESKSHRTAKNALERAGWGKAKRSRA